jgi:flagellar biosynthesis protein FliQ
MIPAKGAAEKALRTLICLAVAVLLFTAGEIRVPVLDTTTDRYFQEAITKAGLAYATTRVVNASISVIKESYLQLEPAGVGLSLAVGQTLDPIDDMTERLSDVLVAAITSLGVQKLAHAMGISLVPRILAVLLVLLSASVWVPQTRLAALRRLLMRLALLISVARFCLPMAALVNGYLDAHYFAQEIETARAALALGSTELEKLSEVNLPEVDGVRGTLKNSAAFLQTKATEFRDALVYTVTNVGDIVDNLLKLTLLYAGIFVIQVLLLPLVVFWLLAKTAGALYLWRE